MNDRDAITQAFRFAHDVRGEEDGLTLFVQLEDEIADAVLGRRVDDWAKQGAVPMTMSPQEFAKYLEQDIVKWERIVKLSGAKPDQ